MADTHRHYFDEVDWAALQRQHPIGEAFVDFARSISRDELHARQDALFAKLLARAWQTPFYQRH